MKKKLIVCGSIGYGGIEELKNLRDFLVKEDFLIIDPLLKKNMDYSSIIDFRDKKELSKKIIEYDLENIDKSDIVIINTRYPSFGTAMEQYYAYKRKKIVVLFSDQPVPTPWPIHFSDYIAKSKDQLLKILKEIC